MHVVTSYLRGGLGNQLFMQAAAYGYAREHGIQCALAHANQTVHSKEDYTQTVFGAFHHTYQAVSGLFSEPAAAAVGTCLRIPPPPLPFKEQEPWHLALCGYFQDERYLGAFVDDYIGLLRLPNVQSDHDNTCFIHVRRNDYLLPKNAVHNVDLGEYYPQAIAHVTQRRPQAKFLVFSDDIAWCKAHDLFRGMEFCEEAHEVTALVMMSRCMVGGITANSSFSWWGAFLNRNPEKIVVYPSVWFGNGEKAVPSTLPFGGPKPQQQ